MIAPTNTAFSFVDYKLSALKFDMPDYELDGLDVDFSPSGVFIKDQSTFILRIDFAAFHVENSSRKDVLTTTLLATFKFAEVKELEHIPDFFYVNSVAIVFPYLRAFISTLTILGNINLIVLPLYNLTHLKEPLKENTSVIESFNQD
ncbi:MAG: hypothetical protein K9G49_15805 [Taibaiella sp.]|nr:hypothetical protein [Taibaiella sp.]